MSPKSFGIYLMAFWIVANQSRATCIAYVWNRNSSVVSSDSLKVFNKKPAELVRKLRQIQRSWLVVGTGNTTIMDATGIRLWSAVDSAITIGKVMLTGDVSESQLRAFMKKWQSTLTNCFMSQNLQYRNAHLHFGVGIMVAGSSRKIGRIAAYAEVSCAQNSCTERNIEEYKPTATTPASFQIFGKCRDFALPAVSTSSETLSDEERQRYNNLRLGASLPSDIRAIGISIIELFERSDQRVNGDQATIGGPVQLASPSKDGGEWILTDSPQAEHLDVGQRSSPSSIKPTHE